MEYTQKLTLFGEVGAKYRIAINWGGVVILVRKKIKRPGNSKKPLPTKYQWVKIKTHVALIGKAIFLIKSDIKTTIKRLGKWKTCQLRKRGISHEPNRADDVKFGLWDSDVGSIHIRTRVTTNIWKWRPAPQKFPTKRIKKIAKQNIDNNINANTKDTRETLIFENDEIAT